MTNPYVLVVALLPSPSEHQALLATLTCSAQIARLTTRHAIEHNLTDPRQIYNAIDRNPEFSDIPRRIVQHAIRKGLIRLRLTGGAREPRIPEHSPALYRVPESLSWRADGRISIVTAYNGRLVLSSVIIRREAPYGQTVANDAFLALWQDRFYLYITLPDESVSLDPPVASLLLRHYGVAFSSPRETVRPYD